MSVKNQKQKSTSDSIKINQEQKFEHSLKNDLKINFIALAIIIFTVLIMFFSLVKGDIIATNDVGTNDLLYFSLPIRAIYGEALKAGEFLQWTPYIFSGFPVFAEGQNGFLYPFNIITCYLLNPFQALNWFIIFHSILFGFGVFLFIKKISNNGWNSIAMGVAAALCGSITTGHTRHLNILTVIALSPFLFLFIENFIKNFKIKSVLLFGSVLGLMLLTNHPQFSFICGFLAFAYLFIRAIFAYKDKSDNLQNLSFKFYLVKVFIFAAVSIVIAIIIGFPQLRDTLQLSTFSLRTQDNLTKEYTGMGSLPWGGFITFLSPYSNGNAGDGTYKSEQIFLFWEYFHYISIPLFLLSLVSIFFDFKNKFVRIFFGLGLISFLFALGENLGLYKIFALLPVVKSFRFPSRWFFGTEFSLIILSTFGFKILLNKLSQRKKAKVSNRNIKQENVYLKTNALQKILKEKPYLPGLVLALLVFFDIYLITGKGIATSDKSIFFPESNSAVSSLISSEFSRYYTIGEYELCTNVFSKSKGWEGSKELYKYLSNILPPNQPAYYHINSVSGYTNLCPHYIYEVWGDADHQGIIRKTASASKDMKSLITTPNFLKIVRMWGIKNFKTIYNINNPFLLKSDSIGIKHYEVPNSFPRAWIVKEIIKTSSENKKATDFLLDSNFNPKIKAIVNGDIPDLPLNSDTSFAEIIESGNHFLKIKSNSAGLLVLSDTYYPKWKAKVNGLESPLYRVNNSMRGVISPSAGSEIEIYFDDENLKLFAFTSYLMLLFIFSFGIISYYKKNKLIPF